MEVKTYEHVILLDDKPVARGKDLKKCGKKQRKSILEGS
jgi:hypothetical protein